MSAVASGSGLTFTLNDDDDDDPRNMIPPGFGSAGMSEARDERGSNRQYPFQSSVACSDRLVRSMLATFMCTKGSLIACVRFELSAEKSLMALFKGWDTVYELLLETHLRADDDDDEDDDEDEDEGDKEDDEEEDEEDAQAKHRKKRELTDKFMAGQIRYVNDGGGRGANSHLPPFKYESL